jgi:hypothetical protein
MLAYYKDEMPGYETVKSYGQNPETVVRSYRLQTTVSRVFSITDGQQLTASW